MKPIIVMSFLVAVSGFSVWRAVRLWRHPEYFFYVVASQAFVFPFKKDVRRGLVRGWVPFSAAFVALTCGMLALIATNSQQDPHSPWGIVGIGFVALFLLGFVLQLSVVWFNRPRWCIPPYLRTERGVWVARRTGNNQVRRR